MGQEFTGWVDDGTGGASNEALDWDVKEADLGVKRLFRGTLNVRTNNRFASELSRLEGIPCRFFSLPPGEKLGRMRYWEARLSAEKIPGQGMRCWIVRNERSQNNCFEVYAEFGFRIKYGLIRGDQVKIVVA